MKYRLLATVLGTVVSFQAASGLALALPDGSQPIDWLDDLETTKAAASEAGKPIVVWFTAPWCTYCKRMEAGVLSHDAVRNILPMLYIPLRLDYDTNTDLAHRWGVDGLPAFVVLTPEAVLVEKRTGAMGRDALLEWLANVSENWGAVHAHELAFSARQATVMRQVDSQDTTQMTEALQEILSATNWSSERECTLAREVFQGLATKAPALLRQHAEHPMLMVRILIANALREAAAEEQAFDPWEVVPDAAARRDASPHP